MPVRNRQHELDTMAERFIESSLPPAWTCEKVSHDYGKDLRIEIFENSMATGLEFVVQAKGHERFNIVHSNKITQPIRISTLNYLERQLQPPMIIAYSAEQKKACYLWLRPYIEQVLDIKHPDWRKTAGDSEISLHVPIENVFNGLAFPTISGYVDNEHFHMLPRSRGIQDPLIPKGGFQKLRSTISIRLRHPVIPKYLSRVRLTNELAAKLEKGHVLLHADAGYGKTWLIHDFVSITQFKSVIWYTFDESLTESEMFIEDIAAELFRLTGREGQNTIQFLSQTEGKKRLDEALSIFIDELQGARIPILFVFEDLHLATDEIGTLVVKRLLNLSFINVRVIVASRYPLPFGQAKLVAQGLLFIFERPTIAFNFEETKTYLEHFLALPLSLKQIEYLHTRTDQWIAALSLAVNAIELKSTNEIDLLFERLNGFEGNIYDFFAEEVYLKLDKDTRWLLRRLSLTRRIQPATVNFFMDVSNGGQIIKDLYQHNTFLIRDDRETYRFHSLFSEFLRTRLLDEEGEKVAKNIHANLARFYLETHDWFLVYEHGTEAQDYYLAVQGLEKIAPTILNMGHGYHLLEMIKPTPTKYLEESANIQELMGLAYLQVDDMNLALNAFTIAQELYQVQQDINALTRLEFLIAGVCLSMGTLSPEQFLEIADNVSAKCYERNDVLYGSQAELRLIEVGQGLSVNSKDLYDKLLLRSDRLVDRLEQLGEDFDLIKAKALSVKASLLFQAIALPLPHTITKIHVRDEIGHPVPEQVRINDAMNTLAKLQEISTLFFKAEEITKAKSEITWALIRLEHAKIYVHQLTWSYLSTKLGNELDERETAGNLNERANYPLSMLYECAQIFALYHLHEPLASAYLEVADVYDVISDLENRDKFAQEALDIALRLGLQNIAERANKLLNEQFTFSWVRKQAKSGDHPREIAHLSEQQKQEFVEAYLRYFVNEVNVEEMRISVESDVDDMVAVAQQHLEWCRHVQVIQDLRHTKSLETIHREIPRKTVICQELGYRSINSGRSFGELWPFFKGVHCLGCMSRNPVE